MISRSARTRATSSACGERLDQVVVGAAFETVEGRFGAGAGRDQQHRGVAKLFVLAQLGEHAETVEHGHHHVADDHVGLELSRHPERDFAVFGYRHFAVDRQQARQVAAHVGVVVDDENLGGPIAVGLDCGIVVGPGRFHARQPAPRLLEVRLGPHARAAPVGDWVDRGGRGPTRHRDGETRSGAELALHRDVAAVEPHQFIDQRQADAGALERSPDTLGGPKETLEDLVHFVGCDAEAGVAHAEEIGVVVAGLQRDGDLSLFGVLECVGEQVEHHRLPHLDVDVDQLRFEVELDDELQAGGREGGTEDADQVRRERAEVSGGEGGLRATCLQAGEIEQGVDEFQHAQPVAPRRFETRALRVPVGLGPVAQRVFQRTEHQRERRTELVADVAEEGRLGPIQFGQRFGATPFVFQRERVADRGGDAGGEQLHEGPVVLVVGEPRAETDNQRADRALFTRARQWHDQRTVDLFRPDLAREVQAKGLYVELVAATLGELEHAGGDLGRGGSRRSTPATRRRAGSVALQVGPVERHVVGVLGQHARGALYDVFHRRRFDRGGGQFG